MIRVDMLMGHRLLLGLYEIVTNKVSALLAKLLAVQMLGFFLSLNVFLKKKTVLKRLKSQIFPVFFYFLNN